MAWGLEIPAPPLGLQAESRWEGTRGVLRPAGAGRWVMVGFLAFWLCGWAAGETFALGTLLAWLGVPVGRLQLDHAGFSVAAAAFILFWLTLWTLGGLAALYTLLRTAFGRDVFVLRPG